MENKWIHKPQECEGTYHFNGQFLVTAGVNGLLSPEEILAIYTEIQSLVSEKSGLDYLQVFIHSETGQKLFFIDQLSADMIASGEYAPEHNHCTLLLAEEY